MCFRMTKKLVPGKPKEVCVTDLTAATEEENRVDTPGDDGGEDSLPVPQVKIGPDGQIILNEARYVCQYYFTFVVPVFANNDNLVFTMSKRPLELQNSRV